MRLPGLGGELSAVMEAPGPESARLLLDQCVAYAKAHRHQESVDKTIWEVFEEERQTLWPYRGRFDRFH